MSPCRHGSWDCPDPRGRTGRGRYGSAAATDPRRLIGDCQVGGTVRSVLSSQPGDTDDHHDHRPPPVAWPASTATAPAGWERLTDTDGTEPSGWFTTSNGGFRTVVTGYPSWDGIPRAIPTESRHNREDDDRA